MRKPIIALGLCLTAGLSTIPVPSALAATPTSSTVPATQSSSGANSEVSAGAIIQTAMQYLGYPYTATGNSPATGFSCIGFVSYVYRQNGIPLPGDLQDAYAYAPKIAFSNLEPGDVLFFQNTVWAGISHAAIYLGGGRFIHSEWYGEGVKISSFTNDPVDYNYWTQHYLGASRPWTGQAASAVAAPAPTPTATPATVTAKPTTMPVVTKLPLASRATARVQVTALNVRSGPSLNASIQTVIVEGTNLVILGQSNGWYEVQLPNRQIGWVIAGGIEMGTAAVQAQPTPTTSPANNGTAHPTVGNPTSPAQSNSKTGTTVAATVQSRVDGLRVHVAPSLSSQVIGSVNRGQTLTVIGRSTGWTQVRLPSGGSGWISSQYVQSVVTQSDYRGHH